MTAWKRVVALAATFVYVSPAAADPVRITAGSLEYFAPLDFSDLTLTGSMGFTFMGRPATGVFEPSSCAVAPCGAGDSFSLRAEWSGTDLGGTATFNDTIYERVGSLSGNTAMVAQFFGTMMTPERSGDGLGDRAVRTAPFSFEGRFFIEGFPQATVVRLVGDGMTTASFRRQAGSDAWRLDGLHYDFGATAPVPEPSTLLLLLAGAACARAFRSTPRP